MNDSSMNDSSAKIHLEITQEVKGRLGTIDVNVVVYILDSCAQYTLERLGGC